MCNKVMPLISVIIPVYNVEKYLDECINSVVSQTYNNLEIILVDDGSTDNSGKMCDDYLNIDSRITVYHQKNKGLSAARNFGIDKSSGEYIAFVDSDDFISPVFIEMMYNGVRMYEADIAEVTHDVVFNDGYEQEVHFAHDIQECSYSLVTSDVAMSKMLYQKIPAGVPDKLYKRNIFDKVRFPVGYLHEDLATAYKFFLNVEKVALVDSDICAYRMRKDSIVHMKFDERKMIMINITNELYQTICNLKPDLINAAASRAFAGNFLIFLQVPFQDKASMKKLWCEIKKYRVKVLLDRNHNKRKRNQLAALCTFVGMNLTWKIVNFLLK